MKSITIYQDENIKELGDLYGLFFEDINHAADGGLYAELVQNRSFEFDPVDNKTYHSLTAWEKSGELEWSVETEQPLNPENIHYLALRPKAGSYIRNLGFNSGIYVEQGKKYDFSLFARGTNTLRISVEDDEGKCFARGEVAAEGDQWRKYETVLEAEATTFCGRLYLKFDREEEICLDMVSLFPQDTFKGRKNGLRRDIAEALCEMKPRFLRFPGGCLTHDGNLDAHARNSMYRWHRTIGKVEERPSWRNNWGYNQTLGLGYYEYFCFCEDIGAKPLPVVPGGFNPHKGEGVPMEELGAWVEETLALIEFANGGEETEWGAKRAAMGHKEPFGLEYIGIGNEEIGEGFFERYPYFHKAIREKYPDIKIINTAGPFAVGEGYEAGWSSARLYGSDLIDEHYYSSPEWFLANMHHYDDYDASKTKVFLGEYASWGNTYYNALVEAAYMIHLEKAPVVGLACYAPMLANVDYVNWKPDMLWFDNHRIMKTPNYHVQKMFMENQGDKEVRISLEGLDEVVSLTDNDHIAGKITVTGNDVEGRIRNIKIRDLSKQEGEKGRKISVPEFAVDTGNTEHVLGEMDSPHYEVEFDFLRSAGRKGLKICFGQKDEKNRIMWEFGGWDNWDCNLTNITAGRGSAISHRIFHVEDKEYQLRLEVEGRRIRTYVNKELYNDTVDRLPELEELYAAASVEKENGRTILKAVNLTGDVKRTKIFLKGIAKKSALCYSLKGHSLTAENSMEAPDQVTPVTESLTVENNELEYEFAPHSVNVLVFSE